MSEPKSTIEIKSLKEGTTVNIEIPGILYSRLQSLLLSGIPFKDLETAMKTLEIIKTSNEDPDPATFHTRTLMILIAKIEDAAEKQDKLESKLIDKLTGKVV